MAGWVLICLSLCMSNFATVSLADDERAALEMLCRRRKVEALVWKRARAFILLDAGYDPKIVCEILDIGPSVLMEWRFAYKADGLAFFGLKDYSPREGHLSFPQEEAVKEHFSEHPARCVDEIRAYILAEFGQSYCRSGASKLMRRLGFEYKKPLALSAQADPDQQQAFIDWYEALMTALSPDEAVVFSDAVHPEYQSRPAHGWFPKGQKTAVKTTSGRKRLNIQGALNLETFQFTFVEGEKINAETTRQMLEKIEQSYPTKTAIHVILDNARYHHAKILTPWLESPERRVKLHFLPSYAPHLNAIERLWGIMHKWVTHNQHYPSFAAFTVAIFEFFRKTLPENWTKFRDTVTDNFRVVATQNYKVI